MADPTAMIEQAWEDFQNRFHETCEDGPELAADVPAELRALFDRTVGRAIQKGHVWDLGTKISRFALIRLHDVAALAILAAGTGKITAAMVHDAAEQVIAFWQPRCDNERFRKVFCDF